MASSPLIWPILILSAALPAAAEASATPDARGTIAPLGVSLTGSTIDALGRTIGGVEVRLHTTNPDTGRLVLRTAESDRHGRFLIGDLSPGLYRVIAVKGGYAVLVGQVNTLYQKTLDLILRPSGERGTPGSTPDSGAWALRLPQRDPLEEREFDPLGLADSTTANDDRGLSLPLSLELVAIHRDGHGDTDQLSAAGVAAEIASTFEVSDAGFVGISYRHQRDGDPAESADRFDAVRTRYVPRPGDERFPVALKFDAERLRRDRLVGPAEDGAEAVTEHARLRARWTATRTKGVMTAALDAATMTAVQSVGDSRLDVTRGPVDQGSRIDAEFGGRRSWGENHETTYSLLMRSVAGGLDENASGGKQLALVPLVAELDSTALGTLETTTADLRIENRWLADAVHADMRTRVRVEHGSTRDQSMRAAAAVGTTFAIATGLVVDLDGGVGVVDTRGAVPVWSAGLSGGGERFAWSVASRSEVGIASWSSERVPSESFDAVLPVVTDRDGRLDSVSASATWRQREGWPEVRLSGEKFEISGTLAAFLPGDLPWVPVDADGRGEGAAIDLFVDVPKTGTYVSLAWSVIEDRGVDRVLLSGADGWIWQQLNVRQRLGESGWHGARWQLVVGVEHGRVTRSEPADAESPRVAFLSQRRISGGVALAF